MAARPPRRSFATPFVITLAAAPACYVTPVSKPSDPPRQPQETMPAQPPPPSTTAPAPAPATQGPPPVIVNPPMPQAQTVSPNTKWSVYKQADGACMAAVKVECKPQATCNPPPPFKYECPQGATLPATVASNADGTACVLEYPMPKCPPNTACNPPRPTPVACPVR